MNAIDPTRPRPTRSATRTPFSPAIDGTATPLHPQPARPHGPRWHRARRGDLRRGAGDRGLALLRLAEARSRRDSARVRRERRDDDRRAEPRAGLDRAHRRRRRRRLAAGPTSRVDRLPEGSAASQPRDRGHLLRLRNGRGRSRRRIGRRPRVGRRDRRARSLHPLRQARPVLARGPPRREPDRHRRPRDLLVRRAEATRRRGSDRTGHHHALRVLGHRPDRTDERDRRRRRVQGRGRRRSQPRTNRPGRRVRGRGAPRRRSC